MEKVYVVYKKSTYELYHDSPDKKIRDFIESDDKDAEEIRESHRSQAATLETIVNALEKRNANYEALYRGELKEIGEFPKESLVVAVGGDGTSLEVAHYIKEGTMLVVNSDPKRSVGFYSCCSKDNFEDTLDKYIAGTIQKTTVNRMQVSIDGKTIPELVLNDILLAHPNPAATTRYEILENGTNNEEGSYHKDSGLLVCTAMGSTAFVYQEGGDVMPLDSDKVEYRHRASRQNNASHFTKELNVKFLTREGKIYVDGEHIKYDVTLGTKINMIYGQPITIVGDLNEKRQRYI
jgi:NAD+ kinase